MTDFAIKVENLSKQYRLGLVGTGTLSHDLNRWWARIRGKEDPFLKIGEANDRSSTGKSDYVWSLKDINFEVKQGEVLGIIGKNGAGKSTLLKILSKVTGPTTGKITAYGRIGALLEVGTGFHPELTGRENIFLNGAILGMKKHEIKAKLDEIIDFSGCARYIDTPTKRYSSGMTVRLAFAVAAFLDPEILIVDEVLAVGDAEFQKKAIGKMQDISRGEGRTVLFVSHNMTSIKTLCSRAVILKQGSILLDGPTASIVDQYLSLESYNKTAVSWKDSPKGDNDARLIAARIVNKEGTALSTVYFGETFGVEMTYELSDTSKEVFPNIHLFTIEGTTVFVTGIDKGKAPKGKGIHTVVMWLSDHLLNTGTFYLNLALSTLTPVIVHAHERQAIYFEVIEDINQRNNDFKQAIPGIIRPNLEWEIKI